MLTILPSAPPWQDQPHPLRRRSSNARTRQRGTVLARLVHRDLRRTIMSTLARATRTHEISSRKRDRVKIRIRAVLRQERGAVEADAG